jgi:hypothetical protein
VKTTTALAFLAQSLVAANAAQVASILAQEYLTSIGGFSEASATVTPFPIDAAIRAVGVNRSNPVLTVLQLPDVAARGLLPVSIFDWSDLSGEHEIDVVPAAGQLILPSGTQFTMVSTPTARAGVTLYPSVELGGWLRAV